ncbi:flagellar assembly protein [Buchnera aphidicola (Nipponaphis monzeni)]|uniref:Flagellar assembly protein FliH n=1 Tax=Buchnera aphidicola (Nipponaphis monzeni) TaxID=2495405 RepID=A0A455T9S1_9GAMM|nr:FliH/SctL family protein [Buchnera aphidicola]BBI01076.1 flagellar assembly protein [Buchnera aphidicola (Nipponaphis monzeni)]
MNNLLFKKEWQIWFPQETQSSSNVNVTNKNSTKFTSLKKILLKNNEINTNERKYLKKNNQTKTIYLLKKFKKGEQIGYSEGLKKGEQIGYSEGLKKGEQIGYSEGLKKGEQIGYSEGLKKGEQIGYSEGLKKGEQIGYSEGLKKGVLQYQNKYKDIQEKLQTLITNFKISLKDVDGVISNRILNIIIKITKKFFCNEIKIQKNSILIKKIKKILTKDLMFAKKLQLHINPKDEYIINYYFGKIIKLHHWQIFCNINISRGGFKIISQHANYDNTLPTYWKELCKTIIVKENNEQ